ncbi:hypothetical protein RRF57_002584 [Xylaria bambusicola]|uniref:Uncharacterized protein n=1 Tax=Xylaria bambusicola TaxID=326684 RepID=A0AAN7UT36_9PEZI
MFRNIWEALTEETLDWNQDEKNNGQGNRMSTFGSKTWCLTQPPGDILLEAQRKVHRKYEPVPRGRTIYWPKEYPEGPPPAALNPARDIVYRAGFYYPLNCNYKEYVGRPVSDGTCLPNPDRELGRMKWPTDLNLPQPMTFPRPTTKFSYPNPSLPCINSE